jgi:hypothetical protein
LTLNGLSMLQLQADKNWQIWNEKNWPIYVNID